MSTPPTPIMGYGTFLRFTFIVRYDVLLSIIHLSGCLCFSNTYISQDSVATSLRYGGIFYHRFTGNWLLCLSVKEFWKSVSTWQS